MKDERLPTSTYNTRALENIRLYYSCTKYEVLQHFTKDKILLLFSGSWISTRPLYNRWTSKATLHQITFYNDFCYRYLLQHFFPLLSYKNHVIEYSNRPSFCCHNYWRAAGLLAGFKFDLRAVGLVGRHHSVYNPQHFTVERLQQSSNHVAQVEWS